MTRENLRHWVFWHNADGMAGLGDAKRVGRPRKLADLQMESLRGAYRRAA